jgi:signal transduction histidine kinase
VSFPRPKSTFLLQGILILGPSLLLVGIGFLLLRQDRVWVEHDAASEAGRIAQNLAVKTVPEALRGFQLKATVVQAFRSEPREASREPLMRILADRGNRTLFLLDGEGDLIYPTALLSMESMPLNIQELSEKQLELWKRWNSTEAGFETNQIIRARLFLEGDSPRRFAAWAHYFIAAHSRRLGDFETAIAEFQKVATDFADVTADDGFRLSARARWQLMEIAAQSGVLYSQVERAVGLVEDLESALGSFLVLVPTEGSEPLLQRLVDLSGEISKRNKSKARAVPPATKWRAIWRVHQEARDFYARHAAEFKNSPKANRPRIYWLDEPHEKRWLVVEDLDREFRGITAASQQAIGEEFARAIAAEIFPNQYGATVEVGGERVWATPGTGRLLSSFSSASEAGENSALPARRVQSASLRDASNVPEIRVSVWLARPEILYARQRSRTLWFGGLIAASAASVFAGFLIARNAFERQRKLGEMKSNFVSSVSHELRAPIASVRLMAEELECAGGGGAENGRVYYRFIVQECRRLSALIENVLDFSRIERGRKEYEFESTDFAALAEITIESMRQYAARREVKLTLELRGEIRPGEADGRAIQQVLVNLLDNAVKHSPAGGGVLVVLEFSPQTIMFSVHDRGEGIPVADHEKIFQEFFRRGSELRRETEGVGLGLTIVKSLVEAHGGEVMVRSEVGKGSCFVVVIPANRGGCAAGGKISRDIQKHVEP